MFPFQFLTILSVCMNFFQCDVRMIPTVWLELLVFSDLLHGLKKNQFTSSESNKISSFLERAFVRLEAWFQWFNTTQSGNKIFFQTLCFTFPTSPTQRLTTPTQRLTTPTYVHTYFLWKLPNVDLLLYDLSGIILDQLGLSS